MKIAIGGFQHETNTFAPGTTGWVEFNTPGGWPPLTLGEAIPPIMQGRNLPIAGMIEAARAESIAFEPLVWCQAEPGGMVERAAYERVVALFLEALAEKGPFDGILLDLHGAMVVAEIGDGEGDFLARIRSAVGPDVPIACSLDLHANVSQAMVDHSDFLSAYRTYPHVDMAETGRRTATILFEMVRRGHRFAKFFRQAGYLLPIPSQCTLADPTRGLYQRMAEIEAVAGVHLSFSPGFPPSDTPDCGPSMLAYGLQGPAAVEAEMQRFAALVDEAEARYAEDRVLTEDEGVALARTLAETATRPVILVDTQDNPGAGGTGDTTGLVRTLLRHGAENAIVACLYDPEAAETAHRHGVGARYAAAIGGRSGPDGVTPLTETVEVLALADGPFSGTGDFYAGSPIDLGPVALLRVAESGVSLIVGSRRSQAATQALFYHLGVDPRRLAIIGLKSSVHFRADFQAMAERIVVVKSPGYNTADPAELPYRKIRPTVRRSLGPVRA